MMRNGGLYLALRWLLQMDRPVPPRTDAEITAEIERNYRWNFTVNLLDGAAFWFGASFISSSTILPLFISKLTDSPFALGMLAVIAQASWFLPQLFTANAVERLARKKPVVVNLGFFSERLAVWFMVAAALLAARSPGVALVALLAGYAWFGLGAGIIATAWQDLIARCFPVARRGRFFGVTMFVGAGIGTAASGFSAWLLRSFPFPTNFAYAFAIAALAITISWGFLSLTREPAQPVTALRQSNRQFWADLPRILRRDVNFRRFLAARLLLALGGMGAGFITVAAIHRWQVADGTVGVYTAALLMGQTAGNLAFGFLSDRFGHKLSLELSALAAMLAFVLAWLAPAPAWFFGVFALWGVSLGGIIVSGILVVMEFCPPQKRPTYIGLANTAVGLVGAASPLLAAWIAGVSYNALFALGATINLLALAVMRWWVREPRQENSYQ